MVYVADTAMVENTVTVSHDAWVEGHAVVGKRSALYDTASVSGYAVVDSSYLYGTVSVSGLAKVENSF